MCPFVEKKEKSVVFSLTYSTTKPPTLFLQPRPTLPLLFQHLLLIIITMSDPSIIPTPPIIRDLRVSICIIRTVSLQ